MVLQCGAACQTQLGDEVKLGLRLGQMECIDASTTAKIRPAVGSWLPPLSSVNEEVGQGRQALRYCVQGHPGGCLGLELAENFKKWGTWAVLTLYAGRCQDETLVIQVWLSLGPQDRGCT